MTNLQLLHIQAKARAMVSIITHEVPYTEQAVAIELLHKSINVALRPITTRDSILKSIEDYLVSDRYSPEVSKIVGDGKDLLMKGVLDDELLVLMTDMLFATDNSELSLWTAYMDILVDRYTEPKGWWVELLDALLLKGIIKKKETA